VEKIWLKSYQEGVPAEVDLSEFQSLGELFEKSVASIATAWPISTWGSRSPTRNSTSCRGISPLTCSRCSSCRRAARVALMMPNLLQYPVCIFGALRAGYTVVNCNPLYTERELEHQLKDSGAEAIVIVENFASRAGAGRGRSTPVKHVS
jgi:long-chain acyl-CoA synthetase